MMLHDLGEYESQTQAKKNMVRAVEVAAKHLGNTPTICRKSYVHPEVIGAYFNGTLLKALDQQDENAIQEALHGLRSEEVAVLIFLQE